MGLDEIRVEIDRVDRQLRELFLQRMELSRRVAESKKATGAAVYVPKREQEVLIDRIRGTEEYILECRAFFESVMEISRTYQYSRLSDRLGDAKQIPKGEGKIKICFSCDEAGRQPAVFLNAVMLAGLCIEDVDFKREEGKLRCRICLSGDFSKKISKAVILQILEEGAGAEIFPL